MISHNNIMNIIYTLTGTLLVFYITTVGTYIYTSSNNIVALQKEVKHMSTQLQQVTKLLETHSSDKWNILLLKQELQHLSQQVEPFITYGKRFSREDYEIERNILIQYVDNKYNILKNTCCVEVKKQNVVNK